MTNNNNNIEKFGLLDSPCPNINIEELHRWELENVAGFVDPPEVFNQQFTEESHLLFNNDRNVFNASLTSSGAPFCE